MTKPDFDPEQSKFAEVVRTAEPAEGDTEDRLLDLYGMVQRRRKDPELERRYAALREQMAAQLKREGPRYFIDPNGNKRYAYVISPETLEVDVAAFILLHEEGRMPDVDLNEVMPRGIHREAMRRAIAQKKVPADVIAKTMRYVPGTARVDFGGDPTEAEQ